METGIVNIHGKEYQTVAYRVKMFRDEYKDHSITTDIIEMNEVHVVIKATILNHKGTVVSTGHAEEVRGSTNINKTSAVENCETSAIGRALAGYGLLGTEFATADEVQHAITNKKAYPTLLTFDELLEKFNTAKNLFELDARKKKYVKDINNCSKKEIDDLANLYKFNKESFDKEIK